MRSLTATPSVTSLDLDLFVLSIRNTEATNLAKRRYDTGWILCAKNSLWNVVTTFDLLTAVHLLAVYWLRYKLAGYPSTFHLDDEYTFFWRPINGSSSNA
jgi:hypothetical protein